MNLILCGVQACGKTTIGKKLAMLLEWDFIDTDEEIEKAYGKNISCRQIALVEGETYFRSLEKRVIDSFLHITRTVIALGGGSLMHPENEKNLRRIGKILYLKFSSKTAWERIIESGIPSYVDQNDPEGSFHKIAAERVSIYERAANFIFDVENMSVEEMIKQGLHGQ
jgi:shikimate kinase